MKVLSYLSGKNLIAQVLFYSLLMLILGYFSNSPTINITPAEETNLKLTIRHSGRIIGECEPLSKLKQEHLPTNMQRLVNCPREKSSMLVSLTIDDKLLYNSTIKPSGVHNDGVLAAYSMFTLKTGKRHIVASATSSTHEGEFVDRYEANLDLSADQIVVLQLNDHGFKIDGFKIDGFKSDGLKSHDLKSDGFKINKSTKNIPAEAKI